MSFISYAQNFEDVMLYRVLKHVENGFYIDVGAYSPDEDSVTRSFYENGWTGINVEPNPELYKLYLTKRKKDINLQIALSDKAGEAEIYFSQNAGLSSLDKNIAESHKKIGLNVTPSKVVVKTLEDICAEHTVKKEIHFLKVDVEGLEEKVLLGNVWNKFRPWVVVVEATMPMSQVENHEEWESILTDSEYLFAYADGLNRFYVAKEHEELLPAFKYPPNIFDDFILAGHAEAQIEADEAKIRAHNATLKMEESVQKMKEAQNNAKNALNHYESLINSKSWKLTKPLRFVLSLLRILTNKAPQEIPLKPKSKLARTSPTSSEQLSPNGQKIYDALQNEKS